MKREKKQLSFFVALIPIVGMIVMMIIGLKFLKVDSKIILILAACLAGLVAMWAGYTWKEIVDSIVDKVGRVLPALFILLTVGILIGTWMASGTLPMMIYYGLQIISPKFLAVTAFIVTCILSLCTGTSWGSVGTVGVVLIGIAHVQDANLAMVAGAIISGAYFGDKLSPLSDTTNLAPVAAGSQLYEHIKHMLWTTVPGFIVCIIVYLIAGIMTTSASGNISEINVYLDTLSNLFNFNILLILPLVIVLWGSITKKPTIPVMLGASILAMILTVAFQTTTLKEVLNASIKGFNISMIHVEGLDVEKTTGIVGRLLNRGGLNSMTGTFMVALTAMCFAGAVSVTDSIRIVISTLLKKVKSVGSLILVTVLSGFATAGLLSNLQIAMLITGEMFQDEYKKRGLAAKNLSRTIEDCTTMTVPLIPWTGAALYMSSTLGVSVAAYTPWAILCYTGIIFAVILGYTGIGIAKEDTINGDLSARDNDVVA